MIGNTADAWPYYRSKSEGIVLQVWFSYSAFVPSEYGAKIVPRVSKVL